MFINGFEVKNFCECSQEELLQILRWRNSPEVRNNSFSDAIITENEHFEYVASLSNITDRIYYMVRDDKHSLGVISFTEINGSSANVGYYKSSDLTGEKGIGVILLKLAEQIAIHIGGGSWQTLITETFSNNIPSIKSIQRAGYKESKSLMHDILRYELLLEKPL